MGPFSWNSNQNTPQLPPLSLYLKGGMSTTNFDSFGFDLRKWTKELLAYLHVPTWDESFEGTFNPCSWVTLPQCGTSALDIFNTSGGGVQIRTANCQWFFSDGCDLYLPGALIFPDGSTLGTGNGNNGLQITDGTTTINGVKSLFVSGGTLSGTSPSGVLYVTGGGGTTTDSLKKGTASGTDTYTTTITGITSYTDTDAYLIRFTNGNTTSCTLNINSLGAKSLYKNNDGALIGGDIIDGSEMLCVYNSSLNGGVGGFQCIGTAPNTLLAYVTNSESITITKGQPVFVSGGTGDRINVKLAYNTSDITSAQTIGVVQSTSIGANQKGFIIVQGQLDGLSLFPTSTWADGDYIYLGSTAGTLTNVKPVAPNHLVYLGYVTTASNGSAGRMYVKVQNGYELEEIHNVKISGVTNNDILAYESSTSLWKNKSISGVLGYVPQAQLSGTLPVISGGTGISAITNGDILYASSNTFAKLALGTSGQTLASNGTFPVWTTIASMTNPMTTLNDIIYGGVSGTPTRLASGTTNSFLQMGTNPQWVDLFNTSNTWGAAQNYTAAISGTPFFGLTITNNTQGGTFATTGAGIKYVHNLISGFTIAVNSLAVSAIDKTIYNESLFGWSWRSNGKNANSSANYYWELEGTNEYMSLIRATSAPHTSLNLFTANGGSGSARLNFATGGGTSFIHGTLGRLGFNIASPTSTVHISGSMGIAFLIKAASYTFTATDYGVIFSGSTAAQTITLPTAASIAGRTYELVNVGSVSVTLGTTSSETFLNVTGTPTSLTLAASAGKSIKVLSTGAAWVQLN